MAKEVEAKGYIETSAKYNVNVRKGTIIRIIKCTISY